MDTRIKFAIQVAIAALALASLAGGAEDDSELPATCDSKIYCESDLLHKVQLARVFVDSKTFVDLELAYSEQEILDNFEKLKNETDKELTFEQLQQFVGDNFIQGTELEEWTPPDINPNPKFLDKIVDPLLRDFAQKIVSIWPNLGRKVTEAVKENPDRYSLIPIPNGFIIPGGRFKECYYWDTNWIVEGLLISEMTDTVRNILDNFMYLVKMFGHVPNGSRKYYMHRSQPPLLTYMVAQYMEATNDLAWLSNNIDTMEKELQYWLDKHSVIVDKDNKSYRMLRYYAPSRGPRPESYREDYVNAQSLPEDQQQHLYTNLKSGAESGWDFSSRWFFGPNGTDDGDLLTIETSSVVPVDLNAIFANATETIGNFYNKLKNRQKAMKWWNQARYFRTAINDVFWSEEDGVWFDYEMKTGALRKFFYATNITPLWGRAVEPQLAEIYALRVIEYYEKSQGLNYPGGVPASLKRSGEQWDYPNAWAPLESFVINGLYNTDLDVGREKARELAQTYVRAAYKGFNSTGTFFEKYDVEILGDIGGGGEYPGQIGFGMTNGAVLEMLNKFGDSITLYD